MIRGPRSVLLPGLSLALVLAAAGCAERSALMSTSMAFKAGPGATVYDAPAGATFSLTSAQPGQATGLRTRFDMTVGQLETASIVITVPAAFGFNGFDALGPAGTSIGSYGFDFSPPGGDTVPDVVLTLRSLDRDRAYLDSDFDGAYQSGLDPVVVHTLDAAGNHVFTVTVPFGGDGTANTTVAGFSSVIVGSLSTGILRNPATPGTYAIGAVFTSVDPDNDGSNNNLGEPPRQIVLSRSVAVANPTLAAAMLPGSRAVRFGTTATSFAAIINAGATTATGCGIAPSTPVPASFTYQTTNPSTNQLTGTPNTPVSIAPGAVQTFLVSLTPTGPGATNGQPLAPTEVEFVFSCANADPAPSIPGANTLLLSASSSPPPDIIAVGATPTGNGIAVVPGVNGTGVFSAAATNIGTGATIVARPVAKSGVPVAVTVCETTGSAGGACLAQPAPTVTTSFATNVVRTFAVFVRGTGTPIPADLASSRVLLRFEELDGNVRGATNVAVQTGS